MVFKAGLTAAGHKRVCECTCVRMCVCMRARVSVRPRVYACACVCVRVSVVCVCLSSPRPSAIPGLDTPPACSKRVLGGSWPRADRERSVAGGRLGRLTGEGDGGYAALPCVDLLVASRPQLPTVHVSGCVGAVDPRLPPHRPLRSRGRTGLSLEATPGSCSPHSGQSPVKPHEGRLRAGLGP